MRKLGLLGGATLALTLAAGGAWARQEPSSGPPVLTTLAPGEEAPTTAPETFGPVPAPPPKGDEVVANLDIVLLTSRIWNPNSGKEIGRGRYEGAFDTVQLRAYQDRLRPSLPGRPYVAPVIVSRPGQTVRMKIRNLLPVEENCPGHHGNVNIPHCFNTTNMHSHGLWISPAGISDNVLRQLPPNKTFTYEYEYNIPGDHPAGTFWYHPHVHGSTAIQVSSGLAGALVVKGERSPAWLPKDDENASEERGVKPGDIDLLLQKAPDHVFVLQQIQYACRGPAGKPKGRRVDDRGNPLDWYCDAGETGVLDNYDIIGGRTWGASGRFTTVNGASVQMLQEKAVAGAPERWRLIHGGVADTVKVSIRKRVGKSPLADLAKVGAEGQDALIDRECAPSGQSVPQFEIAADGLTREKMLERATTIMQPGYRSDILVSFPEAGSYCVIDEAINVAQQGVEGSVQRRQLLFVVDVAPGRSLEPRAAVTELLLSGARALRVDSELAARITAHLRAGDLSEFKPHASLLSAKIDNVQPLLFSLTAGRDRLPDGKLGPPVGAGIGRTPDTIRRFNASDFERTLVLGDTDQWVLEVDKSPPVIGHPFHIHVNPFEIESVMNGEKDLTLDPTSEYFGLKGVFKDTLFVEPNVKVVARSHYERYIGDFVLHCHILNHEDVGMMEMVRIADRGLDGKPLLLGHGLTDAGPEGAARPPGHPDH
ncbi:MAG: multicopper oxidase family protein [Caulobacter sp.]